MPTPDDPKPLPPIPVLQRTGWCLDLTASGQSMEPVVHAGDVITVRCVAPRELRPGDLACFRDGDHFVLHRLIEVGTTAEGFALEKGDAETRGRWISAEVILGVAERINGRPIDPDQAARLAEASRREHALIARFDRAGAPPAPRLLGRAWRRLKTTLRRRRDV